MLKFIIMYTSVLRFITGQYYDDHFPRRLTKAPWFSKTTTEKTDVNYIKHVTGSPTLYYPTKDYFGQDFTNFQDKKIVCQMIHELLVEATNHKILARNVRDQHKPAMAFEVGMVIGVIRENYRRMLEVYRELMTQESKFGRKPESTIWPLWAHVDDIRPIYYFAIYEFIRELQWGVTSMVEMLEKIPPEEMNMPPSTIRPYQKPLPTFPYGYSDDDPRFTTTTKPPIEPDDYDYEVVNNSKYNDRKRLLRARTNRTSRV